MMNFTSSASYRAFALFLAFATLAAALVPAISSAQTTTFSVTPLFSTLEIGETVQFQATFNGQDVTSQTNWNIEALTGDAARILETLGPGNFKAARHGTVGIRATYQGSTFLVFVTVKIEFEAPKIVIQPRSASVAVGQIIQLQAIHDPFQCAAVSGCIGTSDVSASASWTSSNTSRLRHLGGGRFEGVSNGTASVTASYGSDSAQIIVTVGDGSGSVPNPGASANDVVLEKKLFELDSGARFRAQIIGEVRWLSGGHFVVSSDTCDHGRNERGGAWIYRENGTFVGEVNYCLSSREGSFPLHVGQHGWVGGGNIEVVDAEHFVLSGAANPGPHYPPMLFRARNGTASYVDRAWSLIEWSQNNDPSGARYLPYEAPLIQNAVYANDHLLMSANDYSGQVPLSGGPLISTLYTIPDFDIVKEGTPSTFNMTPIAGIEGSPFVFGYIGTATPLAGPTGVYRLTSAGPSLVQTLDFGVVSVTKDPTRNRIAVYGRQARSGGGYEQTQIKYYDVTDGGLEFVSERPFPQEIVPASLLTGIAILGDLLIAPACTRVSSVLDATSCGVGVWGPSGGMRSYDPIISLEGTSLTPPLRNVAVSPSGKVVAVSSYATYLYQIKNLSGSPTPPGGPTFPPGPTDPGTDQYPGQNFSIVYGPTSAASSPDVLIQHASVVSASDNPKALTMSIYGRTYTVDVSASEIVNSSWAPALLSDLNYAGRVNVWGTLDATNASLIHAKRVRNPIPVTAATRAVGTRAVVPPFGATPAPTTFVPPPVTTQASTATLNQLNTIMQALQALQSRLAQ